MRAPGTAARRLAAAAVIALSLTAAAAAVPAATPGLGPGVVDNPAPDFPVRLPSQKGPRHRELGVRRARDPLGWCSG